VRGYRDRVGGGPCAGEIFWMGAGGPEALSRGGVRGMILRARVRPVDRARNPPANQMLCGYN